MIVPPRGRRPVVSRAAQRLELRLDEPAPALANPDDLVPTRKTAAGDRADHRVQPRAVPASGENPDLHGCRRWESNPHGPLGPPDFESGASASSATSALRPRVSRPFAGLARPRSCRASLRHRERAGGGSRGNHGFTRALRRVCQFRHFGSEAKGIAPVRRLGKTALLPSLTAASRARRRGLAGEPWVHPRPPARLPVPPLGFQQGYRASGGALPLAVRSQWLHTRGSVVSARL